MLRPEVRHIFRAERPTNLKLGTQMEYKDQHLETGISLPWSWSWGLLVSVLTSLSRSWSFNWSCPYCLALDLKTKTVQDLTNDETHHSWPTVLVLVSVSGSVLVLVLKVTVLVLVLVLRLLSSSHHWSGHWIRLFRKLRANVHKIFGRVSIRIMNIRLNFGTDPHPIICRKRCKIESWLLHTANRKWYMISQLASWPRWHWVTFKCHFNVLASAFITL